MNALGFTPTGDELDVDLDNLIGSHLCVAANSGGGKSGVIRRLLEVTHGRVQQIVLDAEDEFYTLRERFDYVIAGGDGDAPATVANARGLATAALSHDFSLIAQINDLDDDAGEFIAEFITGLLSAPRELWRPVLVVIDEAQRFAPSGAPNEATAAIKSLLQRGRKRGFTAVVATTRFSELNAGVRGLCNNWLLGLVGQSLDRNTAADQLGFGRNSAEAKGLQSLERRQFWAFGPALSRTPVLFRVADTETTIIKHGQARVPTPPAPEALREILAGLATARDESPATDDGDLEAKLIRGAEVRQLREARDAFEQRALRAEDLLARLLKSTDMFQQSLREAMETWGYVDVHLVGAKEHIEANGWSMPDEVEFDVEASLADVSPEAIRAVIDPQPTKHVTERQKSAVSQRPAVSETSKSGPSPAAIAIVELLDRVNPARLTWSQAATMTGRKASGGNFNSARKWIRESGRVVEDGDFIRSAAPDPVGLSRQEAIALWKSVLTNPAPRMIDVLAFHPASADVLAGQLEIQPRGGNWNNGLAQLRRNGVAELRDGKWRLLDPLPGESR